MTLPKRRPRRVAPSRDQASTAFTEVLAQLVMRVPGARAAALVDLEGETVDYAGILAPFDVKVAGAQWRIVFDDIRLRASLARTTFVMLRAGRASYQVHGLPEGYALVLMLSRAAGFGGWRRAVSACCLALGREASWSWKGMVPIPTWYAAHVGVDAKGRPVSVATSAGSRAVEILGAIASGMRSRERGWRVRIDPGHEATLVCEPGNTWYIDDLGALPELLSTPEIKSR